MNIRTVRKLVVSASLFAMVVFMVGCGDDGGNPASNNNNNNNNEEGYCNGGCIKTTRAACGSGTFSTTKPASCDVVIVPGDTYTETGGGLNFKMVKVAGGIFTMGCTPEQGTDCYSDESPAHTVALSDFYIGEFEVTQKLWFDVTGTVMSSACGSYGVGNNYPVYCVSWNDIVNDFLPALNEKTGKNYRLPTEAEWEYAARGGQQSRGYKYSGSNDIDEVAWYYYNTYNSSVVSYNAQPVGGKQPNELGIYDMSGNVWEWVHDWYGAYTSESKTNPTGPETGSYRVYRGGNWYIGARYARVSSRSGFNPDSRNEGLGFRLAVSP